MDFKVEDETVREFGPMTIVEELIALFLPQVKCGNIDESPARNVLALAIEGASRRPGWNAKAARHLLEKNAQHQWIVEAFAANEIYIQCLASELLEVEGGSKNVYCGLPLGHTVDHYDEEENLEWPR